MDTADHKYKEIVAEVPMAEMGDFCNGNALDNTRLGYLQL